MGCANSKVDTLEDVARCNARKEYSRQAVSCYYAHVAAHAAYADALKNMGAALRQFAETDLRNRSPTPQPPPRLPSYVEHLVRSPTPPASILQKQLPSSVQRSLSKQLTAHPTKTQGLDTIGERLECILEQQEEEGEGSLADEQLHEKQDKECEDCCEGMDEEQYWDSGGSMTVVNRTEVINRMATPSKKCLFIIPPARKTGRAFFDSVLKVDDLFLKAYWSGMEVVCLRDTRQQIHKQDNSTIIGFRDHSYKLLNVIFCGRRNQSDQRANETEGPQSEARYASIIEKVAALEEKLYDEVKGLETTSLTYERACAELLQLESKGREVALGKKRANIKLLSRQIESIKKMVDATSSDIAKLRDGELYQWLLKLVHASKNMWQEMCISHKEQTAILCEPLKADLWRAVGATCGPHMTSTRQLEDITNAWHNTFKELVPTQRMYLENLHGWVKLSLIPLETASGVKLGHQTDLPTSVTPPPIYKLCQAWHQALEKLPHQKVLDAINSFAGLVHKVCQLHVAELEHKKKAETLARLLDKKYTALQYYESRHSEPTAVAEDKKDLLYDPLKKRKNAISELSKRVDEEKDKSAKAVQDSRDMTRLIFSSGLASPFEELTRFSSLCSDTYKELEKDFPTKGTPA